LISAFHLFAYKAYAGQSMNQGNKDEVLVLKKGESYVILPPASMSEQYIDVIKVYAKSQPKIHEIYIGQIMLGEGNNISNLVAIKMIGSLPEVLYDLKKIGEQKLSNNTFMDYIQIGGQNEFLQTNLSAMTLLYKK
jgi:hypothetical protein